MTEATDVRASNKLFPFFPLSSYFLFQLFHSHPSSTFDGSLHVRVEEGAKKKKKKKKRFQEVSSLLFFSSSSCVCVCGAILIHAHSSNKHCDNNLMR